MQQLIDELITSEEFRWNQHRQAPRAGVYVFYENGDPLYVGRSNNIRDRIRSHGADSSRRYSATFALKLLREDLDYPAGTAKEIEEGHGEEYRKQRQRVRSMTFRAVPIPDQLEQTLFEIYAILELGTDSKYNDFDTH